MLSRSRPGRLFCHVLPSWRIVGPKVCATVKDFFKKKNRFKKGKPKSSEQCAYIQEKSIVEQICFANEMMQRVGGVPKRAKKALYLKLGTFFHFFSW